jgi:hypothetical protein
MGLLARMNAAGLGTDADALAAMVLSLVDNGKFTPTVFTFLAPSNNLTNLAGRGETSDSIVDWFSNFGPEVNMGFTHTAIYTGRYKVSYFFNFGGFYTVEGPDQCRKRTRIQVYKQGTVIDMPAASSTIPKGDDPWNDMNLDGEFTANKGDLLSFRYNVKNDWVAPSVTVSGTLVFLGS